LLVLLVGVFFAPLVLHPTQVLYSDHSDMLAMHLPMKRFLVYSWQEHGQLPRWCPYSYGGMPFLSDVQVAAFYPLHAPLLFLPEEAVGTAMSWLIVLHVLIAGLTMLAYARHRGLDVAGSLAASIIFMFAGKWLLHILAGGHYIMVSLAWLPLVLLFLEQAIGRRSIARALAAGATFALIVLGTHPQITLYAGLVAAVWSFSVMKDSGRELPLRGWLGRWLGYGLVCAVASVVLSFVQLLPAIEASGQASRGIGVSAREIVGVFGFAVRGLFGPQSPPSWEMNGGFGPLAVGLLLCVPFLDPGRFRWQLACFAGLVLFSVGGAVVMQPLPGFRLFQIPVRMLLPAAFPAAYLAGAGVSSLLALPDSGSRAARILRLGFFAALVLSIFALPNPFLADADLSHVSWSVYAAYWLVDGLCVAGVCWLLEPERASSLSLRGSVLIGCLLVECWLLVRPLVEVRPLDSIYPANEVVEQLVEWRNPTSPAAGPWRVLDRCVYGEGSISPLGSAAPMFSSVKIEPVLGYNSFDVKHYKQLLQMVTAETEPLQPRRGFFGFPITDIFPIEHKVFLDLLGTKYLLQPRALEIESDPRGPGRVSSWKKVKEFATPGSVYSFLSGGMATLPAYDIYENEAWLPRAFVVHDWKTVDSSWTLSQFSATDFRKQALLLDSDLPPVPSATGTDSVTFLEQTPDRIALRVSTTQPGFLVLTENAYPGWTCTIDGRQTPIRSADISFQGVFVTAGNCEVVFEFRPTSLKIGQIVSSIGLIGVLLMLVSASAFRRRKKPRP
jgi:hypothetical protein